MTTLMDRRRMKPFRHFSPSPSYLREDQQIVTPREYRAAPKHYTGVTLLWTLFKICSVALVVIWLLIVGVFTGR